MASASGENTRAYLLDCRALTVSSGGAGQTLFRPSSA
jgi:hypothetical protein